MDVGCSPAVLYEVEEGGQRFKVITSYTVSSTLAWDTRDPVFKKRKGKKDTVEKLDRIWTLKARKWNRFSALLQHHEQDKSCDETLRSSQESRRWLPVNYYKHEEAGYWAIDHPGCSTQCQQKASLNQLVGLCRNTFLLPNLIQPNVRQFTSWRIYWNLLDAIIFFLWNLEKFILGERYLK